MKLISWQLVMIIAIVVICITAIELYALSQGVNGAILSLIITTLVGIPTGIIAYKKGTRKVI